MGKSKMNKSSLVVVWLLFFLAIFSIGYLTTHLVVTTMMNDYQSERAKLEAFDVAFDCHDYDRLRAYRAKLLKGVK